MIDLQTLLTCGAFLAVALLYASTGQAGASGYIAVMALTGYEPGSIKPTALVLNIMVSLVVSWRFIRDRHFSWQLFWPFALPTVTTKARAAASDITCMSRHLGEGR